MTELQLAQILARKVAEQGGTVYYVGGFVRDRLLGIANKDVDVEVHGVAPQALETILDSLGKRMQIGESFGVYALKGYSLDIAMPRRETATGGGHRDFAISVDPYIGAEQAAKRRDFTVNALMQNVLTGEVVDPFGGVEDLRRGILRHVSDAAFAEDPLRVLRAAQFAARFHFQIAAETVTLCKTIDLRTLCKERVELELRKALLKADKPSIFFENLRTMGQLSYWFREVQDLIGVRQSSRYHAEGDVWTHTMLVLDEAAKRRDRVQEPFAFLLSALCHDLGKAVSTREVDGEIHAYGHEAAGVPLAERLVGRLTGERKILRYVRSMVLLHMKPNTVARARSPVKTTNRMFDQAVEPNDLIQLALSDAAGKCPPGASEETFLMARLAAYRETMARPYVMGSDLIAAGLTPDSNFSELLSFAHKLRLAGIPKDSALKQTLAYARTKRT